MGRLVILSGPSCAGKSPLLTALQKLHPEMIEPLQTVVLYNSRSPRPAERDGVDYHFRSREEIAGLRDRKGFVVMEVRADLQAVDLGELEEMLRSGDAFYEGNPFVGRALVEAAKAGDSDLLSVFLSPLSREEIAFLKSPDSNVSVPDLVADVMRRKLLRRTHSQKGRLSLPDLRDIETRAQSAYDEMKMAADFEYVIPNHDGEDSENWSAFYYPLGDARRALDCFAALLRGDTPAGVEIWHPGDPL